MVEPGIAGVMLSAGDLRHIEKECPVCSHINLFHCQLSESDPLLALQDHRIPQWLEKVDIPDRPVSIYTNKGPPQDYLA